MHSMKLAVGFVALFTASTQGFATAGEVTPAPNLAFIKLPGFQGEKPSPAPFRFQDLTLPSAYIFQGLTPIPMEWWEQGSSSPLAIVIGHAEGTRRLDGSMSPAYYWHRDPGNGANNFGSFSFQHLSHQETAGVLDQSNNDAKRLAAAKQALPEIADQRQLVKLRRFHDLLQAQAKRNGIQLTHLELLNGLDLSTQSELAGLDSWGYVDRLTQIKKTVTDPDEQIIRARTWSYWDPVKNRWAAPGLGNTEYYIRRDQARRFDAVKQALLYQEQQPSLLQSVDLAWADDDSTQRANREGNNAEDSWAIALLDHQSSPLEGSSFNRQSLQLEIDHQEFDGVFAEIVAAETVLADAMAQNAALAIANPTDVHIADLDFKGELNRVKAQVPPQQSDPNPLAVALGSNRPLAPAATEAEPAWERLAMTPEEFALATAIATSSNSSEASISLATATELLEAETIALALEASSLETSVETASAFVQVNAPSSPQAKSDAVVLPASAQTVVGSDQKLEETLTPFIAEEPLSGKENLHENLHENLGVLGDINSSLLTVQPFMPKEIRALPLEAELETQPVTEAVKPGQPFKQTPTKIVQLAAMAHVQAAEPLISDRIESQAFLHLASGLKDSPIEVQDESLGLAVASEGPSSDLSYKSEAGQSVADQASPPSAKIHFSPQASPLGQDKDKSEAPWLASEAARGLETPPLEAIITPEIQAMLNQPPQNKVAVEHNISETVVFFEENISQ